jgi:predicted DNA-binding transcriptional regulator YafY
MAMTNSEAEAPVNINISAYRVLFILLMLVRYRSLNTVELNRLLVENPMIGRPYNSETLTKYINTLREVGCRIPRSTNRNDYSYELLKNPFPLCLEPSELEVARKLQVLLAMQPDELLYQDYQNFLQQLFWVADAPAWPMFSQEAESTLCPELTKRCDQLSAYRRYCQEAFTLEMRYLSQEQEEHLLIEPHEVIERDGQFLLLGLDKQSQQQRLLDVDHIVSVRQLPSKNQRPASQTTVVFALYGRLAKSYRLYPNEKIVFHTAEELRIRTKVSDTTGLMFRLMKYGASCQILSPDSLRETVRQHVSLILATLLEPPPETEAPQSSFYEP